MKSPKFQALIVEQKVARDAGSEFVDAIGHDEVHKTKGEIETRREVRGTMERHTTNLSPQPPRGIVALRT